MGRGKENLAKQLKFSSSSSKLKGKHQTREQCNSDAGRGFFALELLLMRGPSVHGSRDAYIFVVGVYDIHHYTLLKSTGDSMY